MCAECVTLNLCLHTIHSHISSKTFKYTHLAATSLTCDSLDDGTIKANHSVFAWAERTNFTLTLFGANANGFGSNGIASSKNYQIHRIDQLDWKSVEIQIHLDDNIVDMKNRFFHKSFFGRKNDRQLNSIGSNFPMWIKNAMNIIAWTEWAQTCWTINGNSIYSSSVVNTEISINLLYFQNNI